MEIGVQPQVLNLHALIICLLVCGPYNQSMKICGMEKRNVQEKKTLAFCRDSLKLSYLELFMNMMADHSVSQLESLVMGKLQRRLRSKGGWQSDEELMNSPATCFTIDR
jgi:hypothetical protein